MKLPHFFEFMDQEWLPLSLRGTLREVLECACSVPFRPYYKWVAEEVLRSARAGGCRNLVELGAGPAPITKLLAKDPAADGLRLVACDYNPDEVEYEALEKKYPGKVVAEHAPVDFSQPRDWGPQTLLYLSATLHHIPRPARPAVLRSLVHSADRGMVFEPLRKNILSILFVFCSLVPALLLPLTFLGRPGKLRRFLWCWLIPVAPLMFLWDGFITCLRQWTNAEWEAQLHRALDPGRKGAVTSSAFCQMISWST
jgi:hypothetical protein